MPSASRWRRRATSRLRPMPGSPSSRSVKRLGPMIRSRTTSSVPRPPTRSRARASAQYCPYVRRSIAASVRFPVEFQTPAGIAFSTAMQVARWTGMGIAVALLAPACALGAADAPRQTASFTWTTTARSAPTGYSMAVDIDDPSDPEAKPHSLRELVIEFPPGTRTDTTAVPQCHATDAELMLEGAAACPGDTRIGGGTIVTDTGSTQSGFPRLVTNDVTQFNNEDEVIGFA